MLREILLLMDFILKEEGLPMRCSASPAVLRRPLVLLAILTFFVSAALSLYRLSLLPAQPRSGEITASVTEIDGRFVTLDSAVLTEDGKTEALNGRLRLKLDGSSELIGAGSRVRIQAELTPLSPPVNPNGWDERTRYLTDGVIYSGTGELTAYGILPVPSLRTRARSAFRASIAALWPDEEDSALMTALLTGSKDDLSDESYAVFRRSGAAHLLAVSGLHVGFVAALVMLCLSFLRKGSPWQTILILLCLGGYLLLAESAFSVFRAFVMLAYARLARSFGRRTDGLSALSAAVIAALLLRPEQSLCAGFLLSTGAVLGILLLFSRFDALLKRILPLKPLRESIALTLSAQLGVLPAQCFFFHTFNPLSLLTNLAAVPLSAGVVMLGLPAALLHPLLPGLSALLAFPVRVLLHMLLALCRTVAASPWASLSVPAPSILLMLSFFGVLFLLSPYLSAFAKRAKVVLCVVLSLIFLLSLGLWLPGVCTQPTEAVFLSVGTADSVLLRSPGGNLLVDTGWTGSQAVRAAQGDGLTIDALILTHQDADHSGGLENLLRSVRVRAVYAPKDMPFDSEKLAAAKTVMDEMNIPFYPLQTGDRLSIGSFQVRVLSPDSVRPGMDNEDSLVLHVLCGQQSLLFLGDIPSQVETALPLPPCDLVKLAHHGSAKSTSDEMLSTVQPRAAILSVGTPNRYGFPTQEVISRLNAHHVPAYRTDENGAILADLSAPELSLHAYSPPSFRTLFTGLP